MVPQLRLALGVLTRAAGLAVADLLALDLARIARDEAGVAEGLAQRLVVLDERAGDAVTDGAGLAGDATAVDAHGDVELVHELHGFERLAHDHAAGFTAEELIARAIVDGDRALAGTQVDTGGGGLATAGA